ncbi:MAG: hypothetical protein WDN01_05050 [Rhizomicrobium sp.]
MFNAPKIVLKWSSGDEDRLGPFVEQCLREGVKFVGVVGPGCARIEDLIDEHVVGDGSDDKRFILTSSHPDETLEEAIAFAKMLTQEYEGDVEVVEL